MKKWYQKKWVIILFLFIFSPIGIALLWINKMFDPKTRKIISGVFTVYFVAMLIYGALTDDKDKQVVNNVTPTPIETVEPTTEATTEPTEEPAEEVSTKPIDVVLDIEPKIENNKVSFTVKTNLPDNAIFMATLRGLDNDYNAGMTDLQSKDGKIVSTEKFTKNEKALPSGKYELSINMVMSSLQEQSVLNLTGNEYENLTGECVSDDENGKFIAKTTTLTIDNKEKSLSRQKEINSSHKKLIKELYDELINECNRQEENYNEIEFGKFLADWNRRRNDIQEKISSEDGTMEAEIIIGDLAILETHLKNRVMNMDYDSEYIKNTTKSIKDFIN